MEEEEEANSFVLRSGVRAGLKREFAFAIASQAALASPLGRTRRSSRTLSTPADAKPKPKPKRPRPAADPPQGGAHAVHQPAGPVLALMAADPSPQPPLEADPDIIIPPESPPRRITRSMLQDKTPLPPHTENENDNAIATPVKPKAEPPEEEEDAKPSPALRRFTRSLLFRDKDSGNEEDLSGTTTASNASSPSPNTTTSINNSKWNNANKVPTNLKELLATGLLEGQPVKYIMRKGKVCIDTLVYAISFDQGYVSALISAGSSFSTPRSGKFALFCDLCLESKGSKKNARPSKVARGSTSSAKGYRSASPGVKSLSIGRLTRKDKGMHKVVFMSGVLPEGTDVGYYVGGKRLLDGYIKELGIYCHCCNTVVSPSQFEAHAGRAARRKPLHDFSKKKFSTRTVLLCDQCGREYHVGCLKEHNMADLTVIFLT
nr:unnamed protein product [Digitaria exilis]